ncbi:unnamed protein product [Brassicogethes aeneus]|uniref:Craniofacial development protein 2-like n=1 Tax=Brassicogethes aeneus TaxID=1431903 RepID=A0A9P0BGP6_BRAAE|nr:unnamed protein product [Brassicogethes aeneus]
MGKEKEKRKDKETKKNWKIGTWNIKSIQGKENELEEEFEELGLDILAITETKKKGQGITKLYNNNILIFSGVKLNERAAAGVGCIIHKKLKEEIEEWQAWSERILTVAIKNKKKNILKTIIIVYGPNENDTKDIKDKFWEKLSLATEGSRGELYIAGDFNSRVGRKDQTYNTVIGDYGENTRNNNEPKLNFKMGTKRGIWLLEKLPSDEFLGARLPSKEPVLLVFIYHHKEMKETLSGAAKSTSTKLQEVWRKANIPVKTEENIRAGIQKLYKEYRNMGKEKSRNTDKANVRRQIWKGDLVDVSQEDKEFLRSQREDHMSSSMGGVDKVFASKLSTKCRKEEKKESYKNKHYKAITEINKTVIMKDLSSSSSAPSNEEAELRSIPRLKPLDQTLTSTWDREQLSIRQASTSFIATAKSLGHDVSKISVSPSTVYRARAINRRKMAKKIEESLFENPPYLVLHWDSKLLPSVAHRSVKTLEDRVAVLVSGKDFEHLLGVPVAMKGTGEQMAEVVIREVDRFGLRDNIIGISFDTTASNTGLIQGACTRIEREFGRTLLWLACRHHTHELIIKGVFEECCSVPSSGPEIQIFQKFKTLWASLDKKSYTTMLDEESPVQGFLEEQRVKMVNYIQNVLKDGSHPREDYKELLQLSLLYLGGWSKHDFSFRVPGALHQARWMAKAIYALKIVLFTTQLNIPQRELNGMKQVAHFVSLIYVRFWHEAIVSRWAPKNDLDMLQLLSTYPDANVRKSALTVARRHLWYLSETNVGLAFFDERITHAVKENMTKYLETKPAKKKEMKRLEDCRRCRKNRILQIVSSLDWTKKYCRVQRVERKSAEKIEVDAIIEVFQRSKTLHEVKYANYIGDDDSKTYNVRRADGIKKSALGMCKKK